MHITLTAVVGGFDGYFIFKYLFLTSSSFADPKLIKVMIDESNKFIKITQTSEYKRHGVIHTEEMFTFKDSMRLLGGMSLNNLCKIYDVQQKLCEYKAIWNTIDLFEDVTPLRGRIVTVLFRIRLPLP